MTCPTTTNTTAAAECFNHLATETFSFAAFSLILVAALLTAAFLLTLFVFWLHATSILYLGWR